MVNATTAPAAIQAVLDAIQKIPSHRHVTILERADFNTDRALVDCVERVLKAEPADIQERVRAEIFGFGPLEKLILDSDITEILILETK